MSTTRVNTRRSLSQRPILHDYGSIAASRTEVVDENLARFSTVPDKRYLGGWDVNVALTKVFRESLVDDAFYAYVGWDSVLSKHHKDLDQRVDARRSLTMSNIGF